MRVSAVADADNEFPVVEEEDNTPTEVVQKIEEVVEPALPVSGFTEEYLQNMNQVLATQPLSAVLEWCFNSLPNFFQVTSFGSAGMVVIHELHKLKLNVCNEARIYVNIFIAGLFYILE